MHAHFDRLGCVQGHQLLESDRSRMQLNGRRRIDSICTANSQTFRGGHSHSPSPTSDLILADFYSTLSVCRTRVLLETFRRVIFACARVTTSEIVNNWQALMRTRAVQCNICAMARLKRPFDDNHRLQRRPKHGRLPCLEAITFFLTTNAYMRVAV